MTRVLFPAGKQITCDGTRDSHLTRLPLCITRAGYSKRDACFPRLGVWTNYPQTSGAVRDFVRRWWRLSCATSAIEEVPWSSILRKELLSTLIIRYSSWARYKLMNTLSWEKHLIGYHLLLLESNNSNFISFCAIQSYTTQIAECVWY